MAKACAGADVVFALTQPWTKDMTVDEASEARQAEVSVATRCSARVSHFVSQGLARGAAKAKVPHLVYTSVVSAKGWEADEEVGQMPHLRSKWIVNRLVAELGVPTTVLGPVMFMDNFDSPFMSIVDGQVR